ncbi:MAG: hypothetical protein ACLU3N_06475 [Lachnospiraceae bacterium]
MKEWLAAICGETWWRKKRERKMRWQAASRYPLPERNSWNSTRRHFHWRSVSEAAMSEGTVWRRRTGAAALADQETACTGCARGMECWRTNYYKNWDVICPDGSAGGGG